MIKEHSYNKSLNGEQLFCSTCKEEKEREIMDRIKELEQEQSTQVSKAS